MSLLITQTITYRCDGEGCDKEVTNEYCISAGSPYVQARVPDDWLLLPNLGYHYCPDCYRFGQPSKTLTVALAAEPRG